ncbi:MAG: DNA segregation ATPase FtsK/SpoIIIE-like protein [Alteromonadaceae bacterium]|jgi:DNA segregation ATPase FtsK/SpoIIIE-like protein
MSTTDNVNAEHLNSVLALLNANNDVLTVAEDTVSRTHFDHFIKLVGKQFLKTPRECVLALCGDKKEILMRKLWDRTCNQLDIERSIKSLSNLVEVESTQVANNTFVYLSLPSSSDAGRNTTAVMIIDTLNISILQNEMLHPRFFILQPSEIVLGDATLIELDHYHEYQLDDQVSGSCILSMKSVVNSFFLSAFIEHKFKPASLAKIQLFELNEQNNLFSKVYIFTAQMSHISVSMLQREFIIGYNQAVWFIELMESLGLVVKTDTYMRKVVMKRVPLLC